LKVCFVLFAALLVICVEQVQPSTTAEEGVVSLLHEWFDGRTENFIPWSVAITGGRPSESHGRCNAALACNERHAPSFGCTINGLVVPDSPRQGCLNNMSYNGRHRSEAELGPESWEVKVRREQEVVFRRAKVRVGPVHFSVRVVDHANETNDQSGQVWSSASACRRRVSRRR